MDELDCMEQSIQKPILTKLCKKKSTVCSKNRHTNYTNRRHTEQF